MLISGCIVFENEVPKSIAEYTSLKCEYSFKNYINNRLEVLKYKGAKTLRLDTGFFKGVRPIGFIIGNQLYINNGKKFIIVNDFKSKISKQQEFAVIGEYNNGTRIDRRLWLPSFKILKKIR